MKVVPYLSNMKQRIYADNAATSQLDINAYEKMKPYLLEEYGNASQPYSFARIPKKAIQEARKIISDSINANEEEIFFTSCGTESDNWAIKSTLYNDNNQIITSQIEHHAILNACKDINSLGRNVTYLPVNEKGEVLVDKLSSALNIPTNLVSIMYANNEIGTLEPINELCNIAHEKGVLFHTDAVQAVGHVKIDVKELNVDMLSASAHKFNGPKGIGFIYIKKGTKIHSLISGGSQEFGMRAGTENVAYIIAMAEALKNNCNALDKNIKHITNLENIFINELLKLKVNYKRNGSNNRIPGNISLSFENQEGERLLHRLDLMGISVSTGSACDSKNTQISHVLQAIKLPNELAKGTIRISLGKNNTEQDVIEIAKCINKLVNN